MSVMLSSFLVLNTGRRWRALHRCHRLAAHTPRLSACKGHVCRVAGRRLGSVLRRNQLEQRMGFQLYARLLQRITSRQRHRDQSADGQVCDVDTEGLRRRQGRICVRLRDGRQESPNRTGHLSRLQQRRESHQPRVQRADALRDVDAEATRSAACRRSSRSLRLAPRR